MATLSLPFNQGGIKLLDLETRNKAIQAIWLQTYLQLREGRPDWAYIADELIRTHLKAKNTDKQARIYMFLQSWKVNPNISSKLPYDLVAMLHLSQELKINFGALSPSDTLKNELPIRHHVGADRAITELTNKKEARWLRLVHHIKTVAEMNDIGADNDPQHRLRKNCSCNSCSHIRTTIYCKNPHKCIGMARRIMSTLPAKWDPSLPTQHNELSLTLRWKARNKAAETNKGPILFDSSVMEDNPTDCIRIFTDNLVQDASLIPQEDHQVESPVVTTYTDGSCIQTGQSTAKAGSSIWFGKEDIRNRALRVPGLVQTNQRAEMYVVLQVIKATPTTTPLVIKSDSYYVIKALTRHLKNMEDKEWLDITNGDLIQTTVAWLRSRQSPTAFQWVKGHNDEEGNDEADKLAAEGTTHPPINHLDLTAPHGYSYTGSKLSAMTQKDVYLGIKASKPPPGRPATAGMIDISKRAIEDMTNKSPTERTIWQSLYNKDLSRPVRYFLWRCIHRVYKIGN
jgi:ribonuclease HI